MPPASANPGRGRSATAVVGGLIAANDCTGHDTQLQNGDIDCEAEHGPEQDSGEGGIALSVSGLIVPSPG